VWREAWGVGRGDRAGIVDSRRRNFATIASGHKVIPQHRTQKPKTLPSFRPAVNRLKEMEALVDES
jgi:hypothetical protein